MNSTQPERIEIIDALRGFALAGILICHFVENYIGAQAPESFNEAVHQGVIDSIIDGFILIFLRGKFIALFSFLFGLSFFIQMNNAAKKGTYFGGRYLWRLLLLLLIGYLHSLFYRGDILTVYGVLGIFLIPFYKLSNKWVIGFATLLFWGLARFIIYYLTNGEGLINEVNINPNNTKIIDYYNTLKYGSLSDVFITNAIDGHIDKTEFQYGVFGRGYFTFAFFLIGLFIGRIGFFKRFNVEHKLIKKVLIISSITLVVSLIIMARAFISLGDNFTIKSWNAMLGFTAMDISNAAMTIIYIALFVMFYKKIKGQKLLSYFIPYGKTALSNYVFQSVIVTGLLFGWGFGLIGELEQRYTFLLALIFIVLQVWLSKLWLNYFKYGPIEWLWRSLTYFKLMPLIKN